MKFTDESYNLICECVEERLSSTDNEDERKALLDALDELDSIGTL